MMVDVPRLKGRAAEIGLSGAQIARALDMHESTYYRKLKSKGVAFTLGQVFKITEKLSLSVDEAKDIFLAQ